MRSRKQQGGNVPPSVEPTLEVPTVATGVATPGAEKAPFLDFPSDLVSGGGKKKKAAPAKKPASAPAKKPASAPAKKPASVPASAKKSKKGGALVEDIKNLAVPFAILLAKQGLEGMFDKKKKAAEKPAAAISARKSTATRTRAAVGGCGSCAPVAKVGGASKKGSRYAELSREIDRFLNTFSE